jgi:putative membrane protein insertion efficiency factor
MTAILVPAVCAATALRQALRIADVARRLPRLVARGAVKTYRYTLSPLIGFHCRHLPTCSEYSDQALDRFGLWAGGWMTLARLCRCQPWGTAGLDFVPEQLPPQSRWYIPWRYGRWRGTNAGPSSEMANSGLPSSLH